MLTTIFFIAGCGAPADLPKQASENNTPTPATQNTQTQKEKSSTRPEQSAGPSHQVPGGLSFENAQVQEDNLELSVKKMKTFMASNFKDIASPTNMPAVNTPDTSDNSFTATTIATGTFQNLNYMSSGSAFLQKKADQYYVVFGQDFKTPNGPDLRVYLTKNSGPTQRSDIKAGINLGALKNLDGKQTYAIPPSAKIEDFHSISIHCKAFNVPWSYAALK